MPEVGHYGYKKTDDICDGVCGEVSKYKKGLRHGPKALKPVPVMVRCRCCARVKLPHFYCCSGERGNPDSSSS